MPDDSSRLFDELLAEAVHEPPLLIPGTTLSDGRFVVGALLGTGGMGAVYRATDTRRSLDVAVKVLSRVEADGIYRLKQEFRSLSNVVHPNLVALHELHSDGGVWFLTMELVDGQPLSRMRWTGRLLRDVFGQIAEAIQAIHRQGKLHRDLKPSNVLVTPEGRVVVLDFGLVSDQELGGAGQTLADDGLTGTPAYMAPEQATGHATPRCDWYAFGTMLYEALFGAPPFHGTGVAALVRKREEPASPPPAPDRDVPEDLEALCLRLLERDAAKRPGYPEVIAVVGAPRTAGASADDSPAELFVGRERELRALERALFETDQGRNRVVTVSGDPGIGKTALVKRFLKLVREDLNGVALSGRCPRWEHVPFRACDSLVDDLSRYLRTLPSERAASVLPRNTLVLTQLFPVLGRLPAVQAIKQRRALPHEPSEIRRLGLAALRELVGNIAAQERLVVFVDDLQWSDLDGARLLASLVTGLDQSDAPATLLIVAHRTQDAGETSGLAAFLDRVASDPTLSVEELHLGALNTAKSRQLAAQLLERLRAGIEDQIADEAEGNPLFIRQLVRHVLEADADVSHLDLGGVLARRIARLTPEEREALAAVCLTPRPMSLGLLSRITDRAAPDLLARRLEVAQLVRFSSSSTDLVTAFHDRVREVVLSGMDAGDRASLHARTVEVLERAADPDLAALTLHYLGCGRELDAAACAVSAAERAASEYAFEQAAGMYRLALDVGRWEVPEQIELYVRLAEALALDRRSSEAGETLVKAASLETDGQKRRTLRLRAADQYLAGGWLKQGIGLLRGIFTDLGLDWDQICRADLLELRRRLAKRGLEFTPRPAAEIDPVTLARLDALYVAGKGLAWIQPQSIQLRFALALEALAAGEPMMLASGLRTVARFDAQLDPDDERVYHMVRRICDENPGAQAELLRPGLETGMAIVRGRPWDQCDAARRTEELLLGRPTPDARVLAVARYHQGMALYFQGEAAELGRRCWGWLEDAEDHEDLFLASWLNAQLAIEPVARGRIETAREMCRKAKRMWAAMDDAGEFMLSLCCSDVIASCDVYDGDDSAWERFDRTTRWFEGSALSRIPFVTCSYQNIRAKTALACALLAGPGRSRGDELLHEAGAAIAARPRGLTGRVVVLPHFRNLATLFSAGLAAARGDTESALIHLDRGLEQLAAAGYYELVSAHARRAKGLLIGGTEGYELARRSEDELRSLGVVDPARHAQTVIPGFSP